VLHEAALTSQFVVLAYCFMPDHVHLLVQGQEEAADLKKFVALFKQRTGFMHKQQTGRPLWQASYFDRVLRRDDDLQAIADYVLQNPVKDGLAGEVGEYPLSGGAYFEALRLDRRTSQVLNPEARRDRAEATVPTSSVDGIDVPELTSTTSRKET
jgi:putative transposase